MKYLLILITTLLMQNTTTAQEKPVLIYVGDPMCSWCYGFAPELSKAVNELKEKVDIQVVTGGLRPYNTETMQDLAGFLRGHWREVHERSGQPFSYEILQEDYVYDTEPPSRAVHVVRSMKPGIELDFFADLQTLFYEKNANMNTVESYLPLVKKYGLDPEEFKEKFASEAMKALVKVDFQLSESMGVRGFPSLILRKGEDYYLVSNGYTTADLIVKAVSRVLQ